MRIENLKTKLAEAPRNDNGDVTYVSLEQVKHDFTEAEITELVNRALYQLEYQRSAHAKYVKQRNEAEKPIKEAFRKLFPSQPYSKATREQIVAAVLEVKNNLE